MATIKLTAAKDSTGDTTFDLVDSNGLPVNLDTIGATKVTVEVCDGVYSSLGAQTISSDTDAVSWTGAVLTVKFGLLSLCPGQYLPKIYYAAPTSAEEVIAGEGYTTEIRLKAVC